MSNLRRNNLTFYEQYVKLFLEGSTPDVYREGREVLIYKTNCNTCPINMLLRYLSSTGIKHDSTDFIVRLLAFGKSSGTYKLRKLKLSYATARETMLSALLGLDNRTFCIHSIRSVTAAVTAGVDDTLLKKHGPC
jgi:hypothetical protein